MSLTKNKKNLYWLGELHKKVPNYNQIKLTKIQLHPRLTSHQMERIKASKIMNQSRSKVLLGGEIQKSYLLIRLLVLIDRNNAF